MNPARRLTVSTLFAAAGATALAASAPAAKELTALLTQTQGNVTIVETAVQQTNRALPVPRRAQDFQVMRSGDEARLPEGASLGLVCSTDRWVEVKGGKNQRLTVDLCSSGKPLPPGTYYRLSPGAGRLRSIKNALVLEGETRGGDDEDFAVPILVSPRNTAILDPRPALMWTQVPEATEYEIELNGPNHFRISVDPSQIACKEKWEDSVICTQQYPTQAPVMPPGTISFLSIRARLSLAGPLREEAQPSRIKRLQPEKGEEIRVQLERLRNLPLGEQGYQLLAADLYAQEGLYADAVSLYRKALATSNIPEAHVTLGDAFLEIGLLRPAAKTYQEVLDGNPGTAVKAAAEFGLGRVEYVRRSFEHAACHFRKARALYVSLGLKEEAAAAEKGAREAGKKNSS